MDEKVCDAQKKLDLEKYKTNKKMAELEELQTQYNQMEKTASESIATDAGDSAEAEVPMTQSTCRLQSTFFLSCNRIFDDFLMFFPFRI